MPTHSPSYAIGADIGGTKINVGLVDLQGRILMETTVPAKAAERQVVSQLKLAIDAVLGEADCLAKVRIAGIGVGSAGQIDFQNGTVLSATDLLPGYAGTPLREMLERHYGLPVFVDNDVNVLAIAEKRLRTQGNEHILCLALGTGVGGAVVAESKLVRGAWGAAGEIGHMSVNFQGPRCMCGNYGCLELYASGTGIRRLMSEKLQALKLAEAPDMDARSISECWLAGDHAATKVMNEAILALATAISGLIHIFNPQTVVIGGGVADIGEPFFARLREVTKCRTMPALFQNVAIEPSLAGSRGGMIGAALQIWEYMEEPS